MARSGTIFGYFYETLAHHYPHKKMEPYLLTIPVHRGKEAVFQHEGEEMLLMLRGKMNFKVSGNENLLEEGDCIYFDSGLAHGGTVIGDEAVKCLIVIFTS
jgi:uncharacterized cupin superfamily protein